MRTGEKRIARWRAFLECALEIKKECALESFFGVRAGDKKGVRAGEPSRLGTLNRMESSRQTAPDPYKIPRSAPTINVESGSYLS